jgi:Zn-dependent protease with chaperone function
VLQTLTATLPPDRRSHVQGIPFVFDDTPGEVNAFAACSGGKALMAITDGLLRVAAHLAEAAATDEIYGTHKLDEYITLVARNQRPGAPVVAPPAGFYTPAQRADARKLSRQAQLFDEIVAFVLGHELAHHYLGHLPCTASPSPLGAGDIARALSGAVPLFNQPNEMAADVGGTNNVLVAGAGGRGWTEEGGLLTMRFFAGVDGQSPVDILFAFESSHPPPAVRTPVIEQTANAWRLAGGGWLPMLQL